LALNNQSQNQPVPKENISLSTMIYILLFTEAPSFENYCGLFVGAHNLRNYWQKFCQLLKMLVQS